ncbi:OmpA family protein [Methylobacterium sp. CM6244]
MRGAVLLAAILALPGLAPEGHASSYTVTAGGAAIGDAPSRFAEIGLPASHWEEKPQPSAAASSGGASSFGAKGMTSEARLKTEANLSALGARREGAAILVELPSDVLFDFDKSVIRAEARPALVRLSEVLAAMPKARMAITGHTDAMGADAYNQALSERRAVSVRAWLVGRGIAAGRLSAAGKGETMPVAPNANPDGRDDPAGRQRNRRVAFLIAPDG